MPSRPEIGGYFPDSSQAEWVRHAVFYQIDPDRFAFSERVTKPTNLEPWESDPTATGYKGGDLAGIVEHLDYLEDLGVNALCPSPIFQATGSMRLRTHDYFQIDPLLGGHDAFARFVAECHEREIRVVIELSIAECSRGFFQYSDVVANGPSSPWFDWFLVGDEAALPAPVLDTEQSLVREFLMQVGEYWSGSGIDGWRVLDIETTGSPEFWKEFSDRVSAVSPNLWIAADPGSALEPGSYSAQLPAQVAYEPGVNALAFVSRPSDEIAAIDAATWVERTETDLRGDSWERLAARMLLLDSREMTRALTALENNPRSYMLAMTLLFVQPGAPAVTYGGEIGLDGGDPPFHTRKTFPWDGLTWDLEIREYMQQLIRLRRRFSSLRIGSWQVADVIDRCVAILRRDADNVTLTVVNTGQVETPVRIDGVRPVLLQLGLGEPVSVRTTGVGAEMSVPARSAALFTVRDV